MSQAMPTVTDRASALERAILHTLLYFDLFDYPLTRDEVVRYLVGMRCPGDEVRACLTYSPYLTDRVIEQAGYFALRGREAVIARRLDRAATSDRLWQHARRFVRVLRVLPFVRMIAITGALSMHNSAAGDDIDVLIVTAPDRVWLTRALAITIVYLGKLCGDTLCPNYVISDRALELDRRTLFIAHEFAQMVPVYGRAVYAQMCAANGWIQTLLPNALRPDCDEVDLQPGPLGRALKRGAEWLLGGRLGNALETWEMHRKMRKFQRRFNHWDEATRLDRDHVKGHFDDHGAPVMRRYAERLAQLEL
jgi:hypothetical protein